MRAGEEILRSEFDRHRDAKVSELLREIDARTMSPHAAAVSLLAHMHIEMHTGEER